MELNHVANRLHLRHSETVVDMLKAKLDFVELRRAEWSIWLRRPGTNVDLQFNRSDTIHRDGDKYRSQVSFLSETPKAALEDLAICARAHEMETVVGSYSPAAVRILPFRLQGLVDISVVCCNEMSLHQPSGRVRLSERYCT
jgi:hypothetical protein